VVDCRLSHRDNAGDETMPVAAEFLCFRSNGGIVSAADAVLDRVLDSVSKLNCTGVRVTKVTGLALAFETSYEIGNWKYCMFQRGRRQPSTWSMFCDHVHSSSFSQDLGLDLEIFTTTLVLDRVLDRAGDQQQPISRSEPVQSGSRRRWLVKKVYVDRDGLVRVDRWTVIYYVDYTCTAGRYTIHGSLPLHPGYGWLSSRVVSVLDSSAEGPGFLNCLHPLYLCSPTSELVAVLLRVARVTAGLAQSNGSLPPGL